MRIGLDVDGVVSNFTQAVIDRAVGLGLQDHFPASWKYVSTWQISPRFGDVWRDVRDDEGFWLGIQPHQTVVPFVPTAYVTQRPCSPALTASWLNCHGFPTAPVVRVREGESKSRALADHQIDVMIDDRSKNFLEISEDTSTVCYLFDRPWNQNVTAGPFRIRSLEEIVVPCEVSPALPLAS